MRLNFIFKRLLNKNPATTQIVNMKVNILNVWIDNLTMEEALKKCEHFIANKEPCYLGNPNVDVTVQINKNIWFENYYRKAALTLVDGVPIMWAARLLGKPLKEKISGSDLVPEFCRMSHKKGYKLFFLGGRPGAARLSRKIMLTKFPNVNIVGTYSPPYGFERDEKENTKIVKMIKDASPDILFVGLGVPKQEKWIEKYYQELKVPMSMGVGVTFEYLSGMVKRAPRSMQKNGLEWFFRLIKEPRRLWKRYLINDMIFFWLLFKQIIK